MASLNKVILIGNLCREPELKQTASGVSVCSFSIGVSRRYKDADGNTVTDFPLIVCWRQTAEFVCRYFHKGDPISIVGQLQTRTYEDLQGKKRSMTEIVADEVGFVAAQNASQNAAQKSQSEQKEKQETRESYIPEQVPEKMPDISAATFESIGDNQDLPF